LFYSVFTARSVGLHATHQTRGSAEQHLAKGDHVRQGGQRVTENTSNAAAEDLYRQLLDGCRDEGPAAIRTVTTLQPASGVGGKVYPPTYPGPANTGPVYLTERRPDADGNPVDTVLLDGYASQANRMEEALLRAVRRGMLAMPLLELVIEVDGQTIRLTSLETPHRCADAAWRDSLLDGMAFYDSPVGRSIRLASATNARPLYRYYPTAAIFGFWFSRPNDSRDRSVSGNSARVARAYCSEIVAFNATQGRRPASRLDPLGIERVQVYKAADAGWTADPAEALGGEQKPVLYGKTSSKSNASAIGHSNIAPSIMEAGGVTMSHALGRSTLSFARLRALEFPTEPGTLSDHEADAAARATLAALTLVADRLARRSGALRSGCELVATHATTEWVAADGSVTAAHVDLPLALASLRLAVVHAAEAGVAWETEPIRLQPTPRLVDLIRRSREEAATTEPEVVE
jgi:CRISPR-associated protein Csb1